MLYKWILLTHEFDENNSPKILNWKFTCDTKRWLNSDKIENSEMRYLSELPLKNYFQKRVHVLFCYVIFFPKSLKVIWSTTFKIAWHRCNIQDVLWPKCNFMHELTWQCFWGFLLKYEQIHLQLVHSIVIIEDRTDALPFQYLPLFGLDRKKNKNKNCLYLLIWSFDIASVDIVLYPCLFILSISSSLDTLFAVAEK